MLMKLPHACMLKGVSAGGRKHADSARMHAGARMQAWECQCAVCMRARPRLRSARFWRVRSMSMHARARAHTCAQLHRWGKRHPQWRSRGRPPHPPPCCSCSCWWCCTGEGRLPGGGGAAGGGLSWGSQRQLPQPANLPPQPNNRI